MKRPVLVLAAATVGLYAAPGIDSVTVSPQFMPPNTATPVTVLAKITDPTLIPSTVVLQKVDQSGKILAVLGKLLDDGVAPDAVAGDKTFTIRLNLSIATTTYIRVSAGFEGLVLRIASPPVTLTAGSPPAGAIEEVSFSDDIDLTKDRSDGTDPVVDPVWKKSNAPADNGRVAYVALSKMNATIKFAQNPVPAAPIPNVRVEGVIAGLGKLVKGGVTLPAAATAMVSDLIADTAFPKMTRFYNPMSIQWRYTKDNGATFTDLGTTTHIVYVTFEKPQQATVYLTTIHLGVSNDGAATQQAVFQNTWALLAGPANVRTWDNRPLYYYRDGVGFNGCALDEASLITAVNGSGQCGSFARLLMAALSVNNLDSEFVTADPKATSDAAGFLVKDWVYAAVGRFNAAPAYKWAILFNLVAIANGDLMVPKQPGDQYGDLRSLATLRGQNTAPPSEKVFARHFVVKIAFPPLVPYYDPSYGVTYMDQNDFENAALDGYYMQNPTDPANQVRVKKSAGLQELAFDK